MKKNQLPVSLLMDCVRTLLQVMLYIVFSRPVRLIYNAERIVPQGLSTVKRGSLFVSNHQSMADPFLVLGHIPTRAFFRIVPFYFPVDHGYYHRWYLRPFIFMLGGYDIGGTKTEKLLGLLRTRELLKKKRTVFLFPEGRINKKNIGDFQRGIEFFVKESSGGVVFVQMQAFWMRWSRLTDTRPVMKFSEVYTFHRNSPRAQELQALMQEL